MDLELENKNDKLYNGTDKKSPKPNKRYS